MKIWTYFLLLTFTACSLSCTDAVKRRKNQHTVKPCIIHPLFFQDELNVFINFQFWFNDSIVNANNIESINHIVYSTSEEEDSIEKNPVPKKMIRYTFDRNGYPIHIQYTDYSEGIIISHQSYQIIGTKHPYYSAAIRLDNTLGVENSSYLLVPLKKKKNVLKFYNLSKGEQVNYIQKKRFWGPLSVDSIVHPKPTDWIVLGTPYRPEKRFKVKNTVQESDVITYEYLNDNFPIKIESREYPFTKKRFFVYSKKGIFTGYVDSTFIDLDFITQSTIRLNYNHKGLPIGIVKIKRHAESEKVFETKETISYTTFDVEQ